MKNATLKELGNDMKLVGMETMLQMSNEQDSVEQ